MTDNASLDELLSKLLKLTLVLRNKVIVENSEPEEWVELLDARQSIMDELSSRFSEGDSPTDEQKQTYLIPAHQADQEIIPMIEQRKQELTLEHSLVVKSKAAQRQYGEYGNSQSAYGAFFDTKK
jgi:flagellar protein FliT